MVDQYREYKNLFIDNDPSTDCLKNKLGIVDSAQLEKSERRITREKSRTIEKAVTKDFMLSM